MLWCFGKTDNGFVDLLYTSVGASARAFEALEKPNKAAGSDGHIKKQD